jgi:Rha family phage regulatory protein
MTTSKVIADVFGKPHRNITRDILALDCSEEFSALNFEQSEYTTTRGKTYQCYNITKDGFFMLAMGFNGKKAMHWKELFIKEFNRLQSGEFKLDERMNEISLEIDCVKEAGRAWSKFGLEVKNRKRIAISKKNALIDDVQLKLAFEG